MGTGHGRIPGHKLISGTFGGWEDIACFSYICVLLEKSVSVCVGEVCDFDEVEWYDFDCVDLKNIFLLGRIKYIECC